VFRVLGVTVMGEVEEAEPVGRQKQKQPRGEGHALIEPARAKGRAVDAFVLGREKEGQQQPLGQEQQRPEGNLQGDENAEGRGKPAVNGQAQEAGTVRQRRQRSPLLMRQARDHAAVVVTGFDRAVHGGASRRHSAHAGDGDQ